MKTLQDMQATRIAKENINDFLSSSDDCPPTPGFVYYNQFYIIVGVEGLLGVDPQNADYYAVMYYCDVFNEGISSRDLRECEEFLYDRIVKDEVQ